jgi:predicted ATPase
MLTRIEIDGFKSFRDFAMDIPPFLVIIGRNAAGKSNLFDAIQLLGRLAGEPVLEAAQPMRGDLADLFHRHTDGTTVDRMSFAVEVLLDRTVTDAFGDTAEVNHSRLRYELTIELRPADHTRTRRPYVVRERAHRIRRTDDTWIKRFDPAQRRRLAVYSGSGADLLETEQDEQGRPCFSIRQQGTQGRKRRLPAAAATATVLSSLTTATDFPLLYALKRELQSWRLLHLDPSALRTPDSYDDPDTLAANGAHLANTLRRLADDTGSDDRPEGVLNDLSADLAAVIPGVVRVRLTEDDARRQRQAEVVTRGEAPFSARVASDGTLRAIALLAALYDPRGAGLICFEEPENGIFPQRLAQFVRYLKNLVERALTAGTEGSALTQLMLSSHSPAILRALEPVQSKVRSDAVFLDVVTRGKRGEPRSRVTRWRAIGGSRQLTIDDAFDAGRVVSPREIAEFEVLAEGADAERAHRGSEEPARSDHEPGEPLGAGSLRTAGGTGLARPAGAGGRLPAVVVGHPRGTDRDGLPQGVTLGRSSPGILSRPPGARFSRSRRDRSWSPGFSCSDRRICSSIRCSMSRSDQSLLSMLGVPVQSTSDNARTVTATGDAHRPSAVDGPGPGRSGSRRRRRPGRLGTLPGSAGHDRETRRRPAGASH